MRLDETTLRIENPSGTTLDYSSFTYDVTSVPNTFSFQFDSSNFGSDINEEYNIYFTTTFVDETQLETNTTVTIDNTATINHDVIDGVVTVTSQEQFDITSSVIEKFQDYTNNANYIDWEIHVNNNQISIGPSPTLPSTNGPLITDDLQEGLRMDLPSVELYNAEVDADGNMTAVGSPLAQGTGSGEYQASYDAHSRRFEIELMKQYQQHTSFALERIY